MDKNVKIAYIAGLFEGEGTFGIYNETKAKRVGITSTDRDVLEKVLSVYGGKILNLKTRKEHWKQAFIWVLGLDKCEEFIKDIYPYLGERRKERADKYLNLYKQILTKKMNYVERNNRIYELSKLGHTQGRIAAMFDIDRTNVNKILGAYK